MIRYLFDKHLFCRQSTFVMAACIQEYICNANLWECASLSRSEWLALCPT